VLRKRALVLVFLPRIKSPSTWPASRSPSMSTSMPWNEGECGGVNEGEGDVDDEGCRFVFLPCLLLEVEFLVADFASKFSSCA